MTIKKRKAVVSGPAGRDLQNIFDYASQFDVDVAHRLVRKLAAKFIELAHIGIEGSSRSFLPENVRAFPYEKHCFYFTVDNGTLTLLRVLHGSQNTDDIVFVPPDEAS